MPATEQTWYNARWMHVIFGVSALALLFTTLWMFVADHNRPWKPAQRDFATLETRFLEMQALQQRTLAFDDELRRREDVLSVAKASPASADVVKRFKDIATTVMTDHKVRGQESHLRAIDEAADRLAKNTPANDAAKQDAAAAARTDLVDAMQATIKDIKFTEDVAARDKKTQGSNRDAARSKYEIAIRDGLSKAEADKRLHDYEEIEKKVGELDVKVGQIKAGRNQLEDLVKQVTKPVDDAEKAVKDQRAEFDRLHKAEDDRDLTWKKTILTMPILGAFGDPLRIQQIWLPDLKIKFPLNQVARFDRCMTCHLGMDRALPGAPTDPAYPHEDRVFVNIKPRKPAPQEDGKPTEPTFENAYGMKIADAGLLNEADVTVVVFPRSPAAEAGVRTADVLAAVNGVKVIDPALAKRMLLDAVDWKDPKPIAVEIRRGLPHPYSAHPRLDLFGSDSSPHAFGKFGCTICHEGQGTATSFQAAEHSPNTVAEEDRWRHDFKWASNHYWDWPQKPKRFVESSCLKCHHDVVELRPSEKFPDPPAPKLVRGYDLVKEYGCFGCHEVKGFAGPNERIGPDLRAEPDYYAWAAVLKQQIAPQLAKFQPAAADARKAEFDLAKQKETLANRKKEAEAAKQTDEVTKIDADIKKIDEQMAGLTGKRLAAEAPINDLQRILDLADKVRSMPDDATARAQLMAQLNADADRAAKRQAFEDQKTKLAATEAAAKKAKDADQEAAAAQQIKDVDAQLAALPAMLLSSASHRIADHFKDVESPGTMRKVGPSLRYVASKVDGAFLHDWIANPKHFRPTTKMPRVFGQYDHLQDSASLPDAKRFEEAEIQGIVAYLQQNSQPFEYQTPPAAEAAEAPADADASAAPTGQIGRGRQLFVTRGCIACHSLHDEGRKADDEVAKVLANAKEHQGPDLSKIGAKLAAGARANGRDPQKWLYTWLKQPNQYHARTKMPNLQLNPVEEVDATGKVVMTTVDGRQVAKTTDPAADIAAFLYSLKGWEPLPAPAVVQKDVDDLAYLHLGKAYREADAKEYLAKGIHGKRENLKGDEIELFIDEGQNVSPEELNRKKLLYVGRRAISKYGCFGCHDLPGFEDAKAIGTGLADWGRKEVDKLAFEQIAQYVGGHGGHGAEHSGAEGTEELHGEHGDTGAKAMSDDAKRKADNHEYFHHELLHGTRAGFAWQKIREPRSYDYKKTETKTFNEWLRMPRFTFPETEDDVEAVMTFVLGLVSEPPAAKYIYNPSPQKKAIVEGLAVLEKFNCAGCHVLRSERLTVKYTPSRPGAPSAFPAPEPFRGYDFLQRDPSAEQVAASMKEGFDGRAIAVLHGLPSLMREEPREYLLEEDRQTVFEPDPAAPKPEKLYRPFMLWEPALVDGKMNYVGQRPVTVPEWLIDKSHSYPAWGGTAARLMMPLAFSITKPNRQDLTGDGTWALVPPPLLGQGRKTQPAWLHDFLLDPHPIRPAVVLRMPKFNMSEAEAWKLVRYFAAIDNVDQTNTFDPRTREEHLVSVNKQHPNSLQDSLKLTANVCSRCHLIGDFVPAGHASAKAPNLERIHKRLRPDYLRPWLANPNSILPYTNMPVNFPHDSLSNQGLYPGTSREQLESEVDFLLNYDTFMKNEVPLSKIVEKFAPPPMTTPAAAGDAAAPTGGAGGGTER